MAFLLSLLDNAILLIAILLIIWAVNPLRDSYELARAFDSGRIQATPYTLAGVGLYTLVFLPSVVLGVINWYAAWVFWLTLALCLAAAYACYRVFGRRRLLAMAIGGGTLFLALVLQSFSPLHLAALGQSWSLLPFFICAIYVFNHRFDYTGLWRSGRMSARLPWFEGIVGGYYALFILLAVLRWQGVF